MGSRALQIVQYVAEDVRDMRDFQGPDFLTPTLEPDTHLRPEQRIERDLSDVVN